MRLFFSLLLMLSQGILLGQTREILFIGNSYIYSNDLPTMFTNLVLSGGDSVINFAGNIWRIYLPGTFYQFNNIS